MGLAPVGKDPPMSADALWECWEVDAQAARPSGSALGATQGTKEARQRMPGKKHMKHILEQVIGPLQIQTKQRRLPFVPFLSGMSPLARMPAHG